MCQKCLINPLPDRDRFVSETGAYLINYNKCVHCNNKTIIKSGKINREENDGEEGENGADDYEEIICYNHYCSSCDHIIAEHYYKFSLQKINADDSGELGKSSAKKSQEYLMECLLCGKGADSVVLYPMKKKNSVSEEINITGNNNSSSGSNNNNNNNNNNHRNNISNDNFDEKKDNGLPDYNEFMIDSLSSSNSSIPPSIINPDDTLLSPDTGKMATFFMKNISIQKKFDEARQQQEKKIKMGMDRSSIVIIEKNDFITGKKINQGGKCEEKGCTINENEGAEEKNVRSADDELNDFINCNDDALLAEEHCDDDDQFDKISIEEGREEGASSLSVEQRKFVVLMQSAEQEKEDVNDDEWQ